MQTYGQTKNIVTAKRELPTKETILHTFDLNQPLVPAYGMANKPIGEYGDVYNTIPEDHKIQYNTGNYEMVIYSDRDSIGRRIDMVSVSFQNIEFYKQTLRQFVPTDFRFMVYTLRELLNECIQDTNKNLQEQDRYPELSYQPIAVKVFQMGNPPQEFTGRGVPDQLRLPNFADLLREFMVTHDYSYLDHTVHKDSDISGTTYTVVAMFHPRPEHLTGMTYLDLFFDVLNKIDERDEERAHRDGTWGTQTSFSRTTEAIARSGIHYMIKNLACKDDVIESYTSMRTLRRKTTEIINLMREFPTIGFAVEHEMQRTADRESAVIRKHGQVLDRMETDFARLFQTTIVG